MENEIIHDKLLLREESDFYFHDFIKTQNLCKIINIIEKTYKSFVFSSSYYYNYQYKFIPGFAEFDTIFLILGSKGTIIVETQNVGYFLEVFPGEAIVFKSKLYSEIQKIKLLSKGFYILVELHVCKDIPNNFFEIIIDK